MASDETTWRSTMVGLVAGLMADDEDATVEDLHQGVATDDLDPISPASQQPTAWEWQARFTPPLRRTTVVAGTGPTLAGTASPPGGRRRRRLGRPGRAEPGRSAVPVATSSCLGAAARRCSGAPNGLPGGLELLDDGGPGDAEELGHVVLCGRAKTPGCNDEKPRGHSRIEILNFGGDLPGCSSRVGADARRQQPEG